MTYDDLENVDGKVHQMQGLGTGHSVGRTRFALHMPWYQMVE